MGFAGHETNIRSCASWRDGVKRGSQENNRFGKSRSGLEFAL